jgi:hypothetical protein
MRNEFAVAMAIVLGSSVWGGACSGNGTTASSEGSTGTGTNGQGGSSSGTNSTTSTASMFPSASASTSGAGGGCGNVTLMQKIVPGNLVVVFDQSDSMNQAFTEPNGMSGGPKYKVAEDAIAAAVSADANLLNVGAIFFPTKATGNVCSGVDPIGTPPQIKIEPGSMFVTDFKNHFSAPGWTLILGTPTKVALDRTNLALPDPSPLMGARAVVLVTDGAPTCDTVQADILAPVQAMFSRGIKTFVVGLPGSANASNSLNAIAMAGGTNTYVSPADPMTLQMAFAQIASDVLGTCTITLNPPPQDPNLVHLLVTDAADPNGIEIPRVTSGDGWTLSPDGKTATLDGAVCAKAKAGGYTSIKFVYGCPTAQ